MPDAPNDILSDGWFVRMDEAPDAEFYRIPRFVAHIDDATIHALTEFYRSFIPDNADVLDLMSSWISHLPTEKPYGRVSGLGMNAEELAANPQLDDYQVHDLNAEPQLPYGTAEFDRAAIAVSIQYLTKPVEVLESTAKALRAGGQICIAMSHRLFPTKAILAFHRFVPAQRVQLVMTYLEHAGFVDVRFIDQSPDGADPLWLVVGTRP